MTTNRIIVALISISIAGASILMWIAAAGIAFNVNLPFSDQLFTLLVNSIFNSEYSPGGFVRSVLALLLCTLPVLLMSILAFIKSYLLPRNVSVLEGFGMEMTKALRNAWLLWVDLSGNFK